MVNLAVVFAYNNILLVVIVPNIYRGYLFVKMLTNDWDCFDDYRYREDGYDERIKIRPR